MSTHSICFHREQKKILNVEKAPLEVAIIKLILMHDSNILT